MITRNFLYITLWITIASTPVFAGQDGDAIYKAFYIETGAGAFDDNAETVEWDIDGWIGTDENKLTFKSEGERKNSVTEHTELWVMYSRNVDTFWDLQLGIRNDAQPHSLSYAIIGVEGLVPYFLETEAHLFISEDGDLSARLRQQKELLITQKLILEPYAEINLVANDVPELKLGSGFSSAEYGMQMRYEITRGFAPYVDLKYERKFGETATIAESHGKNSSGFIGMLGVKWIF